MCECLRSWQKAVAFTEASRKEQKHKKTEGTSRSPGLELVGLAALSTGAARLAYKVPSTRTEQGQQLEPVGGWN